MTGAETVLKWCNDFVKQNGKDPSPYEIFCQLELAIDFEQDYKPEETPQGKYSTEKQDYLDKCAIAAMQAYITNGGAPPDIAICAYEMADSMLAERERRVKQ